MVGTSPRDYIIESLVEKGYEILEVTMYTPASFSLFGGGSEYHHAATFRNPHTGVIASCTGAYLGAILGQIQRFPMAAPAGDEVTA
jgi:hypothetical protein